jgi:uroporphyrinogen III methyltransferase/synthase
MSDVETNAAVSLVAAPPGGERERQLLAALQKRRVVVTRSGTQAHALLARLTDLGATALHWPLISFAPPHDVEPLARAVAEIACYGWIVFTSANAVAAFAEQLDEHAESHSSVLPKIAVVGSATARAVTENGWRVAFQSEKGSAQALGNTLPASAGDRVLFPRADIAAATLPDALRDRGLHVDEVVAYRTVPAHDAHLREHIVNRGHLDALTFASPSSVNALVTLAADCGWNLTASQQLSGFAVICIGETTARAASEQALRVDAIASEPTNESLLDAIAQALRDRPAHVMDFT